MNTNIELRRWLAFGTGVGIEIGPEDLNVVVVRVRPSGASVITAAVVERFRERPAAEWGAEYAAILRKHNVAHVPATAILPRRDVILRVLSLPGVADRDLESAVAFQIDSLHPYGEDEASWAWSRLGPGSALVAIARRALVDDCLRLFNEAGVRLASLTLSAAVLNPAVRIYGTPPAGGFVAFTEAAGSLEAYGESEARPLFSAAFDLAPARA
jgi:Tfp pilus assembly PilM family ATPase